LPLGAAASMCDWAARQVDEDLYDFIGNAWEIVTVMSTRPRMRNWVIALAGLIGAACGGILRGPFYGVIPGLVLGLAAALAIHLLTRFIWKPRPVSGRPWILAGSTWALAAAVSLVVLWPAGARATFRRWVTDANIKFEDPMIFHRWGRDPTFALRFITDDRGLETIVEAIHAIEEHPPRPVDGDLLFYTSRSSDSRRTVDDWLSKVAPLATLEDQQRVHARWLIEQYLVDVPEWWKVPEIRAPRTWHGKCRDGTNVRMRYDPDTGLLYLEIIFT
jgi:hypothetical protein